MTEIFITLVPHNSLKRQNVCFSAFLSCLCTYIYLKHPILFFFSSVRKCLYGEGFVVLFCVVLLLSGG